MTRVIWIAGFFNQLVHLSAHKLEFSCRFQVFMLVYNNGNQRRKILKMYFIYFREKCFQLKKWIFKEQFTYGCIWSWSSRIALTSFWNFHYFCRQLLIFNFFLNFIYGSLTWQATSWSPFLSWCVTQVLTIYSTDWYSISSAINMISWISRHFEK